MFCAVLLPLTFSQQRLLPKNAIGSAEGRDSPLE